MPHALPAVPPVAYARRSGSAAISDVDTGGYDFTIGGHGFRFASDAQHPYQRYSEPTTVHRYDSSLEPGEQTLSELPWIKSQASFHAGAGQLNLEQGFTAFQYQQEQVEHIRFEKSLGVDVWTPGQVSRLPDVTIFDVAATANCMVSASVAGVDYALIAGSGVLKQVKWASGADSTPTETDLSTSLDVSTFGDGGNWNITSLVTDGTRYFGVIQLTSDGFVANMRTYVIQGQVASTDGPTVLYEVPGPAAGSARTNLCTNPSFETNTTGWSAAGSPTPTLAQSTAQAHSGTHSLKVTSGGAATFLPNVAFTATTVSGTTYTFSAWVWLEAGCPSVVAEGGSGFGTSTADTAQWVRLSVTFTATGTSTRFGFECGFTSGTQAFYIDDALLEETTVVNDFFDGDTTDIDTVTYAWTGTANASTSTATPVDVGAQVPGVVGWNKARLMAGLGSSMYELDASADAHSVLPTAKYTYPSDTWTWTTISESPSGILASGYAGGSSSILEFTLDTSGGAPTLTGGNTIAVLPPGERITCILSYLASFLAVGTTSGLRIGTFDTYTGALGLGALSLETTKPVLSVAGRDRFIYATYTDQQQDGTTGLARVDVTMVVDASGRNAWAPDLRPPTSASTGHGDVTAISLLPVSNRIVWMSNDGLHIEGDGPGSDGDAYLQTSRIRFDSAEPKLWVSGRLHGTIDQALIRVTGLTPYGIDDANLGSFGFITTNDDSLVEFGMPEGLHEWIQLRFTLVGSAAVFNTYQAKALPSPTRQHIIQLSANCFTEEGDRYGMDVTDPETPRLRWQNVADLESAGGPVRYVEFTNSGSVAAIVYIDQIQFESTARPNIDNDFGGIISLKLRIITGGLMAYYYTPPTWRNISRLQGGLFAGIRTSTIVYRQDGVWFNIQDAGIDSPVIDDVDLDVRGFRLFFDRAVLVPDSLHDELAAIEPADPSWTPGSLVLV